SMLIVTWWLSIARGGMVRSTGISSPCPHAGAAPSNNTRTGKPRRMGHPFRRIAGDRLDIILTSSDGETYLSKIKASEAADATSLATIADRSLLPAGEVEADLPLEFFTGHFLPPGLLFVGQHTQNLLADLLV